MTPMPLVYWSLLIISNVWLASGDKITGAIWFVLAAAAFITDKLRDR